MDQFSLFARGLVQLNNANAVPGKWRGQHGNQAAKMEGEESNRKPTYLFGGASKGHCKHFLFFYITLKNESTKHIARVTPSGSVVLWSLLCTL